MHFHTHEEERCRKLLISPDSGTYLHLRSNTRRQLKTAPMTVTTAVRLPPTTARSTSLNTDPGRTPDRNPVSTDDRGHIGHEGCKKLSVGSGEEPSLEAGEGRTWATDEQEEDNSP